MTYSVSIQAHPRRKAFIPYLTNRLGDVPVAWDRKRDVWDTWKRAAQLFDPDAEFHVVVQDDALIGKDFYERLEKVLTNGYDAYCLFFRLKGNRTHGDMNRAAHAGREHGGFAFPRMQFAVTTAIRTALIPELIEFCDKIDLWGDDPRITRYVRHRGMEVWYPLPSLVSHRTGQSVISSGRPMVRKATWFE